MKKEFERMRNIKINNKTEASVISEPLCILYFSGESPASVMHNFMHCKLSCFLLLRARLTPTTGQPKKPVMIMFSVCV